MGPSLIFTSFLKVTLCYFHRTIQRILHKQLRCQGVLMAENLRWQCLGVQTVAIWLYPNSKKRKQGFLYKKDPSVMGYRPSQAILQTRCKTWTKSQVKVIGFSPSSSSARLIKLQLVGIGQLEPNRSAREKNFGVLFL